MKVPCGLFCTFLVWYIIDIQVVVVSASIFTKEHDNSLTDMSTLSIPSGTTWVKISYNSALTTLDGSVLAPIASTLTKIWMWGNKITEIPDDSFATLDALLEFDMRNGDLVHIQPFGLRGLTALTTLTLSQNDLIEAALNQSQINGKRNSFLLSPCI